MIRRIAILWLLGFALWCSFSHATGPFDDDDDSLFDDTPAQAKAEKPLPGTPTTSRMTADAVHEAQTLRSGNTFEFCTNPPRLPSRRTVELCPLADRAPGCEALKARCAQWLKPPAPPTAPPSWLGSIARAGVWVLLALVIVVVITVIVRAILATRRDQQLSDQVPMLEAPGPEMLPTDAAFPGLDDAEATLRLGDQRVERGEVLAGLALYLAAALRSLEKRGWIERQADRTNGEYVRSCQDPAAQRFLRSVVRDVERVTYGGHSPDRPAIANTRSYVVELLKVTIAALTIMLLTSCSSSPSPSRLERPVTDPNGFQLPRRILEKQGWTVDTVRRPLEQLKPGDLADRTLFLNLNSVRPTEASWTHIFAWIEDGGRLIVIGDEDHLPKELGTPMGRMAIKSTVVIDPTLGRHDPRAIPVRVDLVDNSTLVPHTPKVSGPSVTSSTNTIAQYDTSEAYATVVNMGRGSVLVIANHELFVNLGMAFDDHVAAFMTLMQFDPHRHLSLVSEKENGMPSNPMSALAKAGFRLAMIQAFIAIVTLFLAVGWRLTRAQSSRQDIRRAFIEHVEAVGGLYARARASRHALRAFARFVEDRLRGRTQRGHADVAETLAALSGQPRAFCEDVWAYSRHAGAGRGDTRRDLHYLRALVGLYRDAVRQTHEKQA